MARVCGKHQLAAASLPLQTILDPCRVRLPDRRGTGGGTASSAYHHVSSLRHSAQGPHQTAGHVHAWHSDPAMQRTPECWDCAPGKAISQELDGAGQQVAQANAEQSTYQRWHVLPQR